MLNAMVTIDGDSFGMGVKPLLADIIRRQARAEGLTPQEYQAVIWMMWRQMAPPRSKYESTRKRGDRDDAGVRARLAGNRAAFQDLLEEVRQR
jgi:hypothetical protein